MTSRLLRLCLFFLASVCAFTSVPPARAQQSPPGDAVRASPGEVLRSAQTIYIRTKSVYFKPAALEQALLDRSEVQQWGLVISREETELT